MNDFYYNSGLSTKGEALMLIAILMCDEYTEKQKEQVIQSWNDSHKPKVAKKSKSGLLDLCHYCFN